MRLSEEEPKSIGVSLHDQSFLLVMLNYKMGMFNEFLEWGAVEGN